MMTKNTLGIALAAVLVAGAISIASLNGASGVAYAENEKTGGQNDDSSGKMMEGRSGGGKAYGTIASIQNDDKGQPAWISSGIWKLSMMPPESNSTKASDARFSAKFTMVKLDGTSKHAHAISDFALASVSSSGNTTTLAGNATMTMKGEPQKDIPITIKIMNGNTINIQLDPKVNAHLGNTPLYGTVNKINGYHAMANSVMPAGGKMPKGEEHGKSGG